MSAGDIDIMCRLCATTISGIGISLLDSNHQNHTREIATALKLEINAENNFPTKICLECLVVLTNWIKLKDKSGHSHKQFCDILGVSQTCGQINVTKNEEIEDTIDGQKIIIIKPSRDPLQFSHDISEKQFPESENLPNIMPHDFHNVIPKFENCFDTPKIQNYTEPDYGQFVLDSNEQNLNDFSESDNSKSKHSESQKNWKIQKVKCPLCDLKYFETNLVLHLKTNHNISDENIPKYFQHKSLICGYCGTNFENYEKLKKHEQQHILPFKCKICEQRFKSKRVMLEHRKTHTNRQKYTCNYCSRSFSYKCSLKSHIKTKHMIISCYYFECKYCPLKFKTQIAYSNHINDIHKSIKCIHCNSYFKFVTDLQKHYKQYHPNTTPFICKICNKNLSSTRSLLDHTISVHDKDQYYLNFVCNLCPKIYFSHFMFQQHCKNIHRISDEVKSEDDFDEQHENSTDFYTDFSSFPGLEQSMKVDEELTLSPPNTVTIVENTSKQSDCPLCPEKFENLSLHLQTVHNIPVSDLPENTERYSSKTFICELCNLDFVNENELIQHKLIHTDLLCDICHKIFDTKFNLQQHIEAQHFDQQSNKKKFNQCKYCKLVFSYPSQVQSHKLQCHPEMMPTCTLCGKRFTYKRYLLDHIKNKHEQYYIDNPWICNICNKQFTFEHNLLNHKKSHTNVSDKKKIWICNICNKRLTSKRNLIQHQKIHTKTVIATPWQCVVCFKYLSSKRNLLEHNKVHTKSPPAEKSLECTICEKRFTLEHNLLKHLSTQHQQTTTTTDSDEMMIEVKPELLHQICYDEIINEGDQEF